MKPIIITLLAVWLAGCDSGAGNSGVTDRCANRACKRYITLYSNDGKVIRQWDDANMFNYTGGWIVFRGSTGKYVYVSGTVISEWR